jgi:hypothetical protein
MSCLKKEKKIYACSFERNESIDKKEKKLCKRSLSMRRK